MRLSLVVVAVLASSVALAQENSPPPHASQGQAWSVVGARTAGAGGNVVHAGVGWPGLFVTWFHGVAPNLDVGVRGGFTYGVEGLVTRVYPGLKVQGVLRFKFVDTGALALAATFEPGPFFNTDGFGNMFPGFAIPLGLRLGVSPASALTLGLSLELPLWVQFGPGGGLNVPILPGLGVEYFVTSSLNLYFKTRMGPTIRPWRLAEFTFDAEVGVGFKL